MNWLLRPIIIFYLISALTSQCTHEDEDCIVCTGQRYTTMPTRFAHSIRHLILSENNISALDIDVLQRYPQIRQLNLDYNEIRSSNSIRAVSALRQLEVFSISGNNLFVLDFQIFGMNLHLQEIVADENPGLYIQETSSNLRQLERISLKSNKLSSFSLNGFREFSGLKVLDLRNNELTFLPASMGEVFPNLIQIYISGNRISHLEHHLILKSDFTLATDLPSSTEEAKQNEDTRSTEAGTFNQILLKTDFSSINQNSSDLDQEHSFADEVRTTSILITSRSNGTSNKITTDSIADFRHLVTSPINNSSKSNENVEFLFKKVILISIYTAAVVNGILIVVAIRLAYLYYVRRRKTEFATNVYHS